MEQHFSPIKDAARLQVGDIIVVPSEAGKKRKHLHMSLGSLSKIGVSSGFTCRSSNSCSAVENLLIKDNGKTRVLVVTNVFHGYGYSGSIESSLMPFIGNRVTEQPQLPVIRSATVCELPYNDSCSQYSRLNFILNMQEYAQNVLLGKVSNNLFFLGDNTSPYSIGNRKDACVSAVYNSVHSQPADVASRLRCIRNYLPCSNVENPTAKMSREEISAFLTRSDIFDLSVAAGKAKGKSEVVEPVVATKKFFVEYAKRGAMFYRPSRKVLETIVARSLVNAFTEYIKRCEEVNSSAEYFMKNLSGGIENVAEKIKEAKEVETFLAKDGADSTVFKQLKEIIV